MGDGCGLSRLARRAERAGLTASQYAVGESRRTQSVPGGDL